MPTAVHRVLSFDADTLLGECAACGPVRMRLKAAGQGRHRPACTVGLRHRRGRRARGSAGNKRRPHGLTPDEARAFRAGKVCAVCGSDDALGVDHCHREGHIRGVLCDRCNRGLGYFRDDPELLRAAADYLETTRAPAEGQ